MNTYMQIRMPKEMKDEFQRIAKENAQNPSQLVRNWITKYIEENKKEELNKMLKEVDVRVTSDWLKENMESLYEGILLAAEQFVEDEYDTFSADDLEELKEGFCADITVSRFGDKWKIATYINGGTTPWFHDDLDTYPENEIAALMHLAEEE